MQSDANSSNVTYAILDILFADEETFESLIDDILPCLHQATERGWFYIDGDEKEIIVNHPDKALALLDKVLPSDPLFRPHNLMTTLEEMEQSQCTSPNASILQKLIRKWENRL